MQDIARHLIHDRDSATNMQFYSQWAELGCGSEGSIGGSAHGTEIYVGLEKVQTAFADAQKANSDLQVQNEQLGNYIQRSTDDTFLSANNASTPASTAPDDASPPKLVFNLCPQLEEFSGVFCLEKEIQNHMFRTFVESYAMVKLGTWRLWWELDEADELWGSGSYQLKGEESRRKSKWSLWDRGFRIE